LGLIHRAFLMMRIASFLTARVAFVCKIADSQLMLLNEQVRRAFVVNQQWSNAPSLRPVGCSLIE
jgi:hypothetical protein